MTPDNKPDKSEDVMREPINFTSKFLEREQEKILKEQKCYKDHNGDTWFSYQYEYRFLDKTFGLELWARNKDEAFSMREAVCKTLNFVGTTISCDC